MTTYRFIEPLDVLFLRGNKLFGGPGSYGEALLPPWPSVAAGAIRSQILVNDDFDLSAFGDGIAPHPNLGTPEQPGDFRLREFALARNCSGDGGGAVETLYPMPSDLVVISGDGGGLRVHRLEPRRPAGAIETSAPLAMLPVLSCAGREKPVSGLWLTQAGWQATLWGETPDPDQFLDANSLWKLDPRVGVGLNTETRRADDGKLFSVEAVAFREGIGFLVAIDGAEPPTEGLIRFGGDGRAAASRLVHYTPPQPDYEAIANAGRCRIVLTSPGIFPDGWRLPGAGPEARFTAPGVSGRLICAAVARADTISGWDLARHVPKSAHRVVPTGSVYWLDELVAAPEALCKLAEHGLWSDPCEDSARRAEGFNRFALGPWL